MKRVTWKLMKHIEDPKTESSISLQGVTVTGTHCRLLFFLIVYLICLGKLMFLCQIRMPRTFTIWG